MNNWLLLLLCVLCAQFPMKAQHGPLPDAPFSDSNYIEDIASVQWHLKDFPLVTPIIKIGANAKLRLDFDMLISNSRRFTYSIFHCDADWSLSDLEWTEYARGYQDPIIEDYYYSSGTYEQYVHYQLTLPNDDLEWTKSGQYILVVYLDERPRRIAFTRRFYVVDPKAKVESKLIRPFNLSASDSHQEFELTIDLKDFQVQDPMNQIRITILQNGRWSEALRLKAPRYFRGNQLIYDKQGDLRFPAGNEFRPLDIRSVQFRAPNVYSINHYRDGIEITVETDRIRAHKNYFTYTDIDGNFIILNRDRGDQRSIRNADTIPLFGVKEDMTRHTESEYATVYFSLEAPQTLEYPIYLTGPFANWKALPEYRMKFDPLEQIYYTSAYLKQGYYDYYYVQKYPDGRLVSEDIEGNYYETENQYITLVYYRPFGGRYDRIIAAEIRQSE